MEKGGERVRRRYGEMRRGKVGGEGERERERGRGEGGGKVDVGGKREKRGGGGEVDVCGERYEDMGEEVEVDGGERAERRERERKLGRKIKI